MAKGDSVHKNVGNIAFAAQASGLEEGTTYTFAAVDDEKNVGDTISIDAAHSVNFSNGAASKTIALGDYETLYIYLVQGTTVLEKWGSVEAYVD